MKTKRFIAFILVFSLLSAISPAAVFADDESAAGAGFDTDADGVIDTEQSDDEPAGSAGFDIGLITSVLSDMGISLDDTATRAMFTTALYSLLDAGNEPYTPTFTDIPEGSVYASAAGWAETNGITFGVGNNMFAPDAPITREQACAMIYRGALYMDSGLTGAFMIFMDYPDLDDVSDYAFEAMVFCVINGIIPEQPGSGENLNPKGTMTVSEAGMMLISFINAAL